MQLVLRTLLVMVLLAPSSALALQECQGDLNKDSFKDERKKAQTELQATIIEYRKLEQGITQPTSEATRDSELAGIKARMDKQDKTVADLNSKYFPSTPVMAFGAACRDMRWLEQAKAKLVENPQHLGRKWYVWLDKTSRKPTASLDRPSMTVVAQD